MAGGKLPAVSRWGFDFAKVTVRTMWLCWKLCVWSPVSAFQTFAEKSADAVAATSAVSFSTADHTAPCNKDSFSRTPAPRKLRR